MKKDNLLCLDNNPLDNYYAYNLTLKKYTDNSVRAKKTSFLNIKGRYIENQHNGTLTEEELEVKSKKYLKQVKTNIIDLGFNNKDKFDYFITLTFDDKMLGGIYSHDRAVETLKKWINNQKHQNPGMSYILVPEFHKSGRLHFHGLVGGVENWKFSKAYNPKTKKPIIINGLQVYNLDNYKLGFTTISFIKDKDKVTNYISKYATKELITLKSKKRYWYSRNLEKPKIDYDYIDTNLNEHFKDYDITFNELYEKDNCDIELCNFKLPII